MCRSGLNLRRWMGALLLASGAVLSSGTSLWAQAGDSEGAQIARERLDSLIPLLQHLGARKDSAEEALRLERIAETRIELDTFKVGPFLVAAEPGRRTMAEEIFQDTWETLQPMLEGSESLADPYLFIVLYTWEDRPEMDGDSIRWVRVHRRQPKRRLWERAQNEVAQAFGRVLPQAISLWRRRYPLKRVRFTTHMETSVRSRSAGIGLRTPTAAYQGPSTASVSGTPKGM